MPFFYAADAIDEHNLIEYQSQSAVLMLDPAINPETLNIMQDPTF
jgi:hypothetical protein